MGYTHGKRCETTAASSPDSAPLRNAAVGAGLLKDAKRRTLQADIADIRAFRRARQG